MLQGVRLKRFQPFAVLGFCLLFSSQMGGLKFVPIYEALTIKAQKNSPPYIAFEELMASEKNRNDWAKLESLPSATLASGKEAQTPLYSQRIELPVMVVTKTVEMVVSNETVSSETSAHLQSLANNAPANAQAMTSLTTDEEIPETDDRSWMKALPQKQAQRLREAHSRDAILDQKWDDVPTWSDMARQVLAQAGVTRKSSTPQQGSSSSAVYVAAHDASGQVQTQVPPVEVYVPHQSEQGLLARSAAAQNPDSLLPATQTISGVIEIAGGLAVTNEHHIEIRRTDEGILKETGKVNLRDGLYNITIPEKVGTLQARLVSKEGKVLGEGSYRLSRLSDNRSSTVQGPSIRIKPIVEFAAVAASAYATAGLESAPAQTKATLVKGDNEVSVKKDGLIAMENVARGSSTVLRTAAPGHLQTASIIISGKENKTSLYPEKMIAALEDIVSQQRMISLEGEPTIIWGKVSLDGKPLAGIVVSNESDPGSEAIYFDQFMIPNPKLKATSDNGIYAFVAVSPGFHSLLATRADAIFGYQNVVVEDGSVAQGDIENTINAETIPLRVYDAFIGDARPATVTMQSLQEDVVIEATGVATITLPQVSRLGLMRVKPEGADYVAARYLYNDSDNFIHVPLVRWSWLSAIKSYLRLDDVATSGVIVGFVPDENFEVYLAGLEKFESRQIVYFDMQGRILQNRKGMAGGGFIIYNVPEDTHEVVVIGNRTQKIYSRVLPVDANSLSVLTFHE